MKLSPLFSWIRRHKTLTVFLFVLLVASLFACHVRSNMGRAPNAADIARFQASPNYVDGQFKNRHELPKAVETLKEIQRLRVFSPLKFLFSNEGRPDTPPPIHKLTRDDFANPPADFRVTWLGHATLLIELDGIRILTDPVFSSASPVPGLMRRFNSPPLARKDLPQIDIVLISHDHYDHLEAATMRWFAKKRGTRFVVPLGVGARLRGWGVKNDNITELDWFQTLAFSNVVLTAAPTHHRSGRTFRDSRATLWSAWIIAGAGHKIFFGGDGGYDSDFALLGEKYGPFDIAALGIGAYNERWAANHLFPEEAVLATRDLRAECLLPLHWGAYRLAPHAWDEPVKRVVEAAKKDDVRLLSPLPGE